MAQSPQGPGWWQASDGEWYPPESHPNYVPPAPAYGQQPPTYGQQPPAAPPYSAPPYGAPPYGAPPAGFQAAGPPPVPETPRTTSKRPLLIAAIVLVVLLIGAIVAVVASGSDKKDTASKASTSDVIVGRKTPDAGSTAGGKTGTDPDKSIKEDAPDATSELNIIGPSAGEENTVVSAAIVDIQNFWKDELPKSYDTDYQPVSGGFYSWSPDEPLPPCTDSPDNISENAFYCGDGDVVAWDDTDLIPHLYETYGDLSVAIVFAHEWGHAIQARVGVQGETVTLEQQADCFAGAWVAHVRDGGSDFFTADGPALDQALAGFLEIADAPGTSAQDPSAHGSAFDRINSFQEGLDGGAPTCAEYTDQSVGSRLVELEFQTPEDADAGGNAPYEDIIRLSTSDLEDYWSKVGEQNFDVTWKPLSTAEPFDGTKKKGAPACGDSDTSGYSLFYCADGNFIAYDDVDLFPDVYTSLGDFAVGALYGSQYSLAAQDQFGIAPDDPRDQNLMADCMTGSWAASIFLQDRITDQDDVERLSLSPGDFDEAVKVLLALGSKDEDGGTQGTGFERVKSFRDGVINGVQSCANGG